MVVVVVVVAAAAAEDKEAVDKEQEEEEVLVLVLAALARVAAAAAVGAASFDSGASADHFSSLFAIWNHAWGAEEEEQGDLGCELGLCSASYERSG